MMRSPHHATLVTLVAIAAILSASACTGGSDADGADARTTADAARDTMPAAAARPPAPDGRECRIAPVTGAGIGDVTIGMTEAELRRRCTVTRDTTVAGPEGAPARLLGVAMGGETVDVEMNDGKVWRIPITDPDLRTADSLGVGTPLARLLALPGVRPAMGEGTYVLSPAHCGISFQLRGPGGTTPPAQSEAQLRAMPAATVVGRMLVVGCTTP